MPLAPLLITLASLIVAAIAFVRAIQYPGRRSWLWWFLLVLALTAAILNGLPLARLAVYFFTQKH